MISFQEQAKLLGELLQKPTNKKCADCGSASPTWASLDFGVFVCSNCSGAHRALGPPVTRIKSTTLDLWSREWFANMVLGNNELNLFWEGDAMGAAAKRPKSGAPLEEYNRFVFEKYVRRRFVTDKQATHPLAEYKNRNYNEPQSIVSTASITDRLEVPAVSQPSRKPKSDDFSLLDDPEEPKGQNNSEGNFVNAANQPSFSAQKNYSNTSPHEDQFDDYVEAVPSQLPSSKSSKDPSHMSFDDLFKNPQLQTHHSQSLNGEANGQNQHTFQYPMHSNYHMGIMNGMHGHRHQSSMPLHAPNQYVHNPYVGYVPRQIGHSLQGGQMGYPQQGQYNPYPNFSLQ